MTDLIKREDVLKIIIELTKNEVGTIGYWQNVNAKETVHRINQLPSQNQSQVSIGDDAMKHIASKKEITKVSIDNPATCKPKTLPDNQNHRDY